MRGRIGGLLLFLAGFAHPLAAQRTPSSVDAGVVRAELAAVLLQSRHYDDAAREYRAILTRQPNNFSARLGLARALAWGERPREAELELRRLRAQRPGDREVNELLLTVRETLEPSSAEAATWLAERPAHLPYRLALARALVRERKAGLAVPHFERLLAYDFSTPLVLEAANAYVATREHDRAALLLHRILDRLPGDTAARHALAYTLADARAHDAALAQYDTLIAAAPTAVLWLERAQLNITRRDFAAAEADALASLRVEQSVGGYLLLGDLRRWRGDYANARVAYGYARVLRPNDLFVSEAHAQLIRDERPGIAFVPTYYPAAGWHARSTTSNDNLGISYTTVGARREVALFAGVSGHVDVELRRLVEADSLVNANLTAGALNVGVAREFRRGAWLGRVHGRGGFVQHEEEPIFAGAVGAAGWLGAWGVAVEYASAPAYPTLMTFASTRLTETSVTAAAAGPLGRIDVAASVQRARISDDNQRATMQLALRYPLMAHLAAIGAGTGVWFAEPSDAYWDPASYISAAAGLELALRKTRGFSFALRGLAGPARSVEDGGTATSLQLTGGGYLSYRTPAQEVGAALNYGTGRAGEYRRLEASLFVSLLR